MQIITASAFKAKCLHLMDLVNQSDEEIIITKNGKPVSRLVPYKKKVNTLFGLHKDQIKCSDDLILPIDEKWDAQ